MADISLADYFLGAWCKLSRASEHLQALDLELDAFLQQDAYEITTEWVVKATSEQESRAVIRRVVRFKREPPALRWGTLVGDVVVNLRAALDHIVYAISMRQAPDEFRDDETTNFPICDSSKAFSGSRTRRQIRGLPEDAQAIVEALQPYQREGSFRTHPLHALREMSNIDKHRSLHVTGWSAHQLSWDIVEVAAGSRIHSQYVRPPGVLESGTTIAEIDFSYPTGTEGTPKIRTEKNFFFTIAFGENAWMAERQVQEGLYEIAHFVEGVLGALDVFAE